MSIAKIDRGHWPSWRRTAHQAGVWVARNHVATDPNVIGSTAFAARACDNLARKAYTANPPEPPDSSTH